MITTLALFFVLPFPFSFSLSFPLAFELVLGSASSMTMSLLTGRTSPFDDLLPRSSSSSLMLARLCERRPVGAGEGEGKRPEMVGVDELAAAVCGSFDELSMAASFEPLRDFRTRFTKASRGAWSFRFVTLMMRPLRLDF